MPLTEMRNMGGEGLSFFFGVEKGHEFNFEHAEFEWLGDIDDTVLAMLGYVGLLFRKETWVGNKD